LAPPIAPSWGQWRQLHFALNLDGKPIVAAEDRSIPGDRMVFHWVNGKFTKLVLAERSDFSEIFSTADGSLWAMDAHDVLRLFGNRFKKVGTLPDYGYQLRAINQNGPPWILHQFRSRGASHFWRLAYDAKSQRATVEAFPIAGAGAVRNAVWLPPNKIRLIGENGLFDLDVATGKAEKPALSLPPIEHFWCLGYDGLGRLWLAGDGLWLWDGHALRDLSSLIGQRSVALLARDPKQPDAIFASFGDSLLWVRVEP
jgi:hypothetical protein